jgi:hypothetical protein
MTHENDDLKILPETKSSVKMTNDESPHPSNDESHTASRKGLADEY